MSRVEVNIVMNFCKGGGLKKSSQAMARKGSFIIDILGLKIGKFIGMAKTIRH